MANRIATLTLISLAFSTVWYGYHYWIYRDVLDVVLVASDSIFFRSFSEFIKWSWRWRFFSFVCQKIFHLSNSLQEGIDLSPLLLNHLPFLILSPCPFPEIWSLLLMFRFFDSVFRSLPVILSSFSVRVSAAAVSSHTLLFLITIILIAWQFSVLCDGIQDNLLTLGERGCLQAFLSHSELPIGFCELICQTFFVLDRSNFGTSIETERRMRITRRAAEVIVVLPLIAYAATKLLISETRTFRNLILLFYHMFIAYHMVMNFVWTFMLEDKVNRRLPNAAPDNLNRDDTCIVCRGAMTSSNAKQLPCGHCCHADCLERWFDKQANCPLCRATVHLD
jgi:hypothetical protein